MADVSSITRPYKSAFVVILAVAALVTALLASAGTTGASTTWSIVRSPNPVGASASQLNDVSCTGATTCTAVGTSTARSSGITSTLVEKWNGTAWSIVKSPNAPAASDSDLISVSCTGTTACTAVGYAAHGGVSGGSISSLAEKWNGSAWSIVSSPNPLGALNTYLRAVWCTGATACTAVGYSQVNPSTITTLVEQWNGTKWSIMSTPNPLGFEASYLNGVSCTGATACTAVGNSFTGTVFSPLVEQWNGTKWSIVSSAKPVGAATSYLVSVACTGATACWAVGYWSGGTVADATLVEKWNGTKWTIVSSPNRPGLNFLSGVACSGATACTAVGNSDQPPISTLVEQWNGTKWNIVSSPNPVGSSNSALQGVSCHGPFCVAVGYANPGSATSTLVEQT